MARKSRKRNQPDAPRPAELAKLQPTESPEWNLSSQQPCESETTDLPGSDLHRTLAGLLSEVQSLRNDICEIKPAVSAGYQASRSESPLDDNQCSCQNADPAIEQQLRQQNDELLHLMDNLNDQIDELSKQNADLAEQVAQQSLRESINANSTSKTCPSVSHDLLSWDQRRELIYRQMEDNVFDAESFVDTLQAECGSFETTSENPQDLLDELVGDLKRLQIDVQKRDGEISELRCILEQRESAQPTGPDDGVAVGAVAIAQMLDDDELIRNERQRLQDLQAEWQEKFRSAEIQASLERAKLSRERQDLAKKNSELEEQIEHLRREVKQDSEVHGKKRRWLAELGL